MVVTILPKKKYLCDHWRQTRSTFLKKVVIWPPLRNSICLYLQFYVLFHSIVFKWRRKEKRASSKGESWNIFMETPLCKMCWTIVVNRWMSQQNAVGTQRKGWLILSKVTKKVLLWNCLLRHGMKGIGVLWWIHGHECTKDIPEKSKNMCKNMMSWKDLPSFKKRELV